MRIIFQKGVDGPDRLSYLRSDGSRGTEDLKPGSAVHDLAHYVVEFTIKLKEGFWGMIDNGASIAEYNLSNEERAFQISTEGYQAEFLATLIQSAIPSGSIDPNYVEMLRASAHQMGLPFPELPSAARLKELISLAQVLVAQWEQIPPGKEMVLSFTVSA